MRLTVLGRSTATPNPGEACSGHLIESRQTRVLVDIGPGVVAQLLTRMQPADLTALVISHMHPDHMLDLVTLRYAFPWVNPPPDRLVVFTPPGSTDQLLDLARGAGDPRFFETTFDIREHDGAGELTFRELRLQPVETQHYVPTWGFRMTDGDGTLAYSADSGPCDALLELARDADLFLCEAALQSPEDDPQPERRGHLTAAEAGGAARDAGARRLVLTHLQVADGEVDGPERAAAEAFGGPAEVAVAHRTYEIRGDGSAVRSRP